MLEIEIKHIYDHSFKHVSCMDSPWLATFASGLAGNIERLTDDKWMTESFHFTRGQF